MIFRKSVLIVEDDPIVALDLSLVLEELECHVLGIAHTYTQALAMIELEHPDILLCDIHLNSSKNGIEIVLSICESHRPQIIYLTALDDEYSIRKAVETNPCGYLTKPYRLSELQALVQLAKQRIEPPQAIFEIGEGIFYDLRNGLIRRGEEITHLTKHEHKILEYLSLNPHRIIGFEELSHHIWPYKYVSDSNRRTLIYRLHNKLGVSVIHVIQGRGCYLDRLTTCSFGITQKRQGETIKSLFERTDQMLYRAKKEGRNQTVFED